MSFTFDEVSKAHDYLESRKALGKIVLSNKW
ncbi:zinc-binding dehydrogenase [Fictibacillus enclensis]